MQDKEAYAQLLWHELIARIEKDWDNFYASCGSNWDDLIVGKKTDFASRLQRQIRKELPEDVEPVSVESLKRIFRAGQLSSSTKVKTLEVFSIYLGYVSWGQFQSENKASATSVIATDGIATAPSSVPQPPVLIKERKSVWAFSGAFLLVLCLGFIYICCEPQCPEEEEIRAIIDGANTVEFGVYSALPVIDTAELENYFTDQGKVDIFLTINRSTDPLRCLYKPRSLYRLIDCKITECTPDRITVKTKEQWRLLWCIPSDERGKLYDVVNEQTYYLVPRDGTWKIDLNTYEGKSSIPSTPPPSSCSCN